jgi:diguanylate cyclase (GGDEF)-like protein
MRARGRVLGAIEVINRSDGGAFDDDDLEILQALANEAALAIENSRLYRLSITDDLTGLYSQRYFKDYLRMELQKAKRLKRPLTVVMLDIDNFKAYNDSHGHAAGDEALVGVSRAVRTCLRDTDVVARYGGEEFAIILPELRPLQGAQICERIRAQVEALNFRQDGRPGGLTVSAGLSSYPESADESTELFVKADQALYAAKRAGKNCVRSA